MSRVLSSGEFIGSREHASRAGGWSVQLARSEVNPASLREADHVHVDAHLMLVLDAGYVSTALGAAAVSRTAQLIYNPPEVSHRDRFEIAGGRFLTITPDQRTFAELAEALAPGPDARVVFDAQAGALARRAAGLAASGGAGALEIETLCLEAFRTACVEQPACATDLAWLGPAQEMLVDAPDATVRELARAAGVHPVYFARAFKRHAGCGPAEYRRRVRVDRAAALLRHGRTPLAETAAASGYVDQAHMTHDFRRWFGCTPARYAAAHSPRGSRGPAAD